MWWHSSMPWTSFCTWSGQPSGVSTILRRRWWREKTLQFQTKNFVLKGHFRNQWHNLKSMTVQVPPHQFDMPFDNTRSQIQSISCTPPPTDWKDLHDKLIHIYMQDVAEDVCGVCQRQLSEEHTLLYFYLPLVPFRVTGKWQGVFLGLCG